MGEQQQLVFGEQAKPQAAPDHVPMSALSVGGGGGVSALNLLTSPLNVIALSKILREENIYEARDCLTPGNYAINATLRMVGSMKVGEPYPQMIVAKADVWGLLAAALSKCNGVTIDKLLREYFAAQEQNDKLGSVLNVQAKAAIEAIKGKTKQTCRGRVTPRVSCELLANASGSIEVGKGKIKKVKSKG